MTTWTRKLRNGAAFLGATALVAGLAAAQANESAIVPPDLASPSAVTLDPSSTGSLAAPAPDTDTAPNAPSTSSEGPATPDSASLVRKAIAAATEGAINELLARPDTQNPLGAGNWKAARDAIHTFYVARDFAPVWADEKGLNAKGAALLARLGRADEDGLDLSAFTLPQPRLAEASPETLGRTEVALSAAAVAYAMQATGARIAPTSISPLITARPEVADPARVLSDLPVAADPDAALARFNPPQKAYQDLRAEFLRLRESAPAAAASPKGPTLKIGMTDPRVPLIRARFGLGGGAEAKDTSVYDARVASAVAAFQKTQGLLPDGALTPATNEAIFAPQQTTREAALRANMEMWRWQPRDMGADRIEVNLPDYTLHLMHGDAEVHRARVVIGKPDTPTPVFSNSIKYILVNPIWRVPDSIIRKEMKPKLAKDPDWFAHHGFKVTQSGDRLVVEQPAGDGNALGHILFMFPNEHSVYLHDTSARGLFATERRAYSHGCVRVEQPLHLAELVMGGTATGWTENRVQSMLGSNERAVFLPTPLPIHLEYFTEFVDETGALRDREDIYGLTGRVAATLSKFRQD